METCSVIQKARLVLILLLTVFSALCAARSFIGSIDTDRTVMTESYFPFNVTDLEEITALPTEFVSTATSSTRGTVTEWGNSASTEITDPLPGFSKKQQPPTEADSATEVNANTGVSTDTENWESPSMTDDTYTSSTISRAGERTLLSVTTNSTAPYTENTSPYSENSSPSSENPSTYSKNTSPSSENPSPNSKNISPSFENPSPYSKNTPPSSDNPSPYSKNTSPSSENTPPSSDNPSPYSKNTSPSSENSSPSSENPSTYSKNTPPSSDNPSPYSKNTSPSSENSSPSSENPSPYSKNTPPSSDNPSPYSKNTSPSSENSSPSSENPSPYFKNTSPSSDNPSPYSKNTSSSSESSSPSSENSSPNFKNTSPSSDNPSPYSKNTSPSSDNPSSYSKNTSSSSENSSPSSENPSPYSKNTSPFSKNSSPYPDSSSRSSENPSPYTEESNSSQTYFQGFTREGRSGSTVNRVSTNGATSPKFDQSDTTSGFFSSHSPTNESAYSETGLPSDISQQSSSTASDSTLNSTPPLTVTNSRGREGVDVTDSGYTSHAGTSQMETGPPITSGSPIPHKEDHAPNTSRPGKESAVTTVSVASTTTESSTGSFRSPAIDHTKNDAEQASSTAPPRVNDTVITVDASPTESPAHTQPFTSETERPADSTEVLATTPATATHRNQFAEEDTLRATTGATTTLTTPAATTSMYQPSTFIEPSTQPTTTSPAPTTPGPQATLSTSQYLPPSRTRETSTHSSAATSAISTDITTLHLETSTATPGKTTHRGRQTTASYSNTAPSRTMSVHTTGNLTDRATTTFEATTTQMHIISTVATGSPCDSNPCGNGGTCVAKGGSEHRCLCLSSWTGSDCDEDMDECMSSPCPSGSSCMNMRGSFSCVCPLGSDLERGRACTRARTFLGTFQLSNVQLNSTHPMSAGLHELQREIVQLLNDSLSNLKGYSRSTLNKREGEGMRISAVHTFSMSAEVTRADVTRSIETFLESCSQAVGHCRVVLHHTLRYKAESLCAAQKTQCDTDRSNCTDIDGTTFCQCRAGYFKHNTEDQSCRECNDGYKLENGTCVRCTFGFGGFNCGNFYKLITVVVSPAGGALLLILIIALIVTCCKKDKNDINKIIFKSGDFQMSPYAEYPKSNRVSMEWGRETIEMQENGSTKNLLQMTDIYYSPALRNSELERSGLYPFSGMPGSRHSCIYPAQWNPSFISDDTRRRDYF